MFTDFDSVIRGDTFTIRFTVEDQLTGSPINVSGVTLTFTVKENTDDPDSSAIAQQIQLIPNDADSVAGIIYATLPAAQTDLLIPRKQYWYDIQMSDGTLVQTYLLGRLRVLADVTRTA